MINEKGGKNIKNGENTLINDSGETGQLYVKERN